MAANTGSYSSGLNLMLTKDARYDIRDIVELHDLAVDDCVGLQIFKSQVNQVKAVALLLQLNCLYGTGTNIESN